MLYTSYLAKLDKLPEEAIKLIITRFTPKWLAINNNCIIRYKNTVVLNELAPSSKILLDYKVDNDWEKYKQAFKLQMETDLDMQSYLDAIEIDIKENNKDFILICYEKDDMHCHRSILRDYFEEQGLECKEWGGPDVG